MQSACTLLLYVTCPAVPYLSTLSHKQHDFRKKKLWNIKCVLVLSTTFVSNVSHSKKNSVYVECPLFLSDFHKTCIFSKDYRKILKY
jgi:hypothetical protein